MMASMLHSMYAISIQISPIKNSSGIKMLQCDSFRLYCEQSLTGVKFIIITSPFYDIDITQTFSFLHKVYADYALKNPFYTLEMPIRYLF
ncbi:hypothetical protein HZS_5180 [Henneguya salminicola]|nr:hypothetical protein HZS_5180 [Henneguya salminicola]